MEMNKTKQDYPLISVMVPAYNHEKYIEKTLNSVIKDNYPNKELVIINDGSNDNTDYAIRKWKDKNQDQIDVNYISRDNKGVTRTLNELVKRSKGEYVTVIASDDYLLLNGIMSRYRYLQDHPEKAAVFGDCIVVDKNGRKTHDSGMTDLYFAKKDRYLTDEGLKREIILAWSVPGGTLMVKRKLYNTIKYNESYLCEDLDFFLKLVSKNLLGFIDERVSAYRVHGKNACMIDENWIRVQKDVIFSFVRNIKYFKAKDKLLFILPLIMAYKPLMFYHIKRVLGLKKK